MKSGMVCRVVHHGAGLKLAIRVKKYDMRHSFSLQHREIIVEMVTENKLVEGYATLTPSFFGVVQQIRAVYAQKKDTSNNLLIDWLNENNIKLGDEVLLYVITPYEKYRLEKT